MCRRFDALMQTAILMHTQCGPRLLEVENNTGWLRDRMTPWYAAYFGDVRGMSQEDRASLAQDVRALLRLLSDFGGWMHSMMLSLPAVCQWADALREGREAAEAHYAQVLEVAGHLAWMEYEAEKSGLKDERIVHRYDMSDNEGEAAMRQIGETREELQSLLEDQHALNLRIGARLTRAMLSDARDTEKAQADELAAQAAEGRRRINHALEIASPEEISKVETARIRLGRMERHVALLNGRAERARYDLDIWNGDDRRTLPPTMEAEAHDVAGLYPAQLLTALSSLGSADSRDQKKLQQQLKEARAARPAEAAPAPAAEKTEDSATVQEMLAMAVRLKNETLAEAQKKADEILASADAQAKDRLGNLSSEHDRLTEQVATLKQAAAEYREKFTELLRQQQELLEKADELF